MIKKLNKEKTCLTYYCIKQCFHFVRSAGKQKKMKGILSLICEEWDRKKSRIHKE